MADFDSRAHCRWHSVSICSVLSQECNTNDYGRWTYIKDVSQYSSLFVLPQKVIFDLGNLINDVYTASFNATLEANFFTAEYTVDPPDSIIPISARQSFNNGPSAWQIPEANASTALHFPRNVNRAVFSVSATGQSDEEFWHGNVFSSETQTFNERHTLLGHSPFREVQILIDGNLAGVSFPFPVIFSGGVAPGLWRPLVGIDTFDLREDEIDITPWLPALCDGASHTFEIRVVGINDDGRGNGMLDENIGPYWVRYFIALTRTVMLTVMVGRFRQNLLVGGPGRLDHHWHNPQISCDISRNIAFVVHNPVKQRHEQNLGLRRSGASAPRSLLRRADRIRNEDINLGARFNVFESWSIHQLWERAGHDSEQQRR